MDFVSNSLSILASNALETIFTPSIRIEFSGYKLSRAMKITAKLAKVDDAITGPHNLMTIRKATCSIYRTSTNLLCVYVYVLCLCLCLRSVSVFMYVQVCLFFCSNNVPCTHWLNKNAGASHWPLGKQLVQLCYDSFNNLLVPFNFCDVTSRRSY